MPRKERTFCCTVLVEFPDGTIKKKEDLTPKELDLFYETVSEKYAEIFGPIVIREILKHYQDQKES